MTGIDGDVAGADYVGVQSDVTAGNTRVQQQVACSADAICGTSNSAVNRDATCCGHQIQVAVGAHTGQVFLRICRGGRIAARCRNTVNSQTQVDHRHRIALCQVSATGLGPGAQLSYRGFNTVDALANGGARHQNQVGCGDIDRCVAQDVQNAADSGQNGHLAADLVAGADFT